MMVHCRLCRKGVGVGVGYSSAEEDYVVACSLSLYLWAIWLGWNVVWLLNLT
jgi:hypothetical protein